MREKDVLKGLTSHTAHSDELATVRDWEAYSEDPDKADSDFLVERRDVFDFSRIEFDEDEQDRGVS